MTSQRIVAESRLVDGEQSEPFLFDIKTEDGNVPVISLAYYGCYGTPLADDSCPAQLFKRMISFGPGKDQYAWTDLMDGSVPLGREFTVWWDDALTDAEPYCIISNTTL